MSARTPLVAVLLLVAGAVPALAAGGEGEHHGPTTAELLWQLVNLVLLLAVLFFAARKPVQAFFAGRREDIQGDLDAASELLQQSEANFAEWQRKLNQLDSDLDGIRATARRRAEEEREAILADARQMAERIQADARASIDQELRHAKSELRSEAADLAVELAGELIRDQVSDGDRERLMDEFISNVEQNHAAGSGR